MSRRPTPEEIDALSRIPMHPLFPEFTAWQAARGHDEVDRRSLWEMWDCFIAGARALQGKIHSLGGRQVDL